MNFGKNDVMILLSMSLAVIGMSFVFPAVGLADADTGASEIPEYTLDTEPMDLAGELPESPGTPSRGTMDLDTSEPIEFSNNQVWLDGGTEGGTEMVLLPATSEDDTPELVVNNWESGSVTGEERRNVTEGGQFVVNNFTYEVTFDVTQFDESNGYDNAQYELEYNVRNQEADSGWLDRVPIVGGIIGAGEALAAIVAWIGSIIWWMFATVIDFTSAALVVLVDTVVFFVSLVTWLVTTYAAIVSNANAGWVSLFVALPGIILSLEFGKLGLIAVSLLPTT